MTVIKILLGIFFALLLFLLLISLLRVGVRVGFGAAFTAELRVGPIKAALYPKKKKKAAADKVPAKDTPQSGAAKKKKRFSLPKLTRQEWCEAIHLAYDTLRRTLRKTCQRLRIDPLTLAVIFGGSDPAAAAENYGRANAILFSAMPAVEELFNIPEPAIHLGIDYAAEKSMYAEGEVGVSLRICDALAIALTLLVPLYKWYRRVKKVHANDLPPTQKQTAAEDTNNESLSA